MIAIDVLRSSLLVAASVAVMMLVIEYVNVRTRGALVKAVGVSRPRQYLIAALVGATPGCFGPFAVVALHADGRVSLGAVAAAMLAATGDEMFVMLSLFPGTAIPMALGLVVLGILSGWITDRLAARAGGAPACGGFSFHVEEACDCFPGRAIADHWRRPRAHRLVLVGLVLSIAGAVAAGAAASGEWELDHILLIALLAFTLFILATVPDHFVEKHLWNHVVREHVPRIFAWTLGAFAAIALLQHLFDMEAFVEKERILSLALASLLGLVPESGPHLIVVRLFSEGALPLSVLVANSAVQDGHGMLPLLAHSRLDFLKIKAVNLALGLAAGALIMLLGW